MWNDGPIYSADVNFEGGINLIANTHLGNNTLDFILCHLLVFDFVFVEDI